MAIKQTHFYRGHSIVHHVYSSDLTDDKIERFIVGVPGQNNQLSAQTTLQAAKATVDDLLMPRSRFIMASA